MDRPEVASMFNRKLDDFLDDMSLTHPSVREFALLKKSSAIIAQVDVSQPMLLFKDFVVRPYGDAIQSRDEAFLLYQTFGGQDEEYSTDVVSLLKGVWRGMDADNQDAVWRHLQTLVLLSSMGRTGAQPPPLRGDGQS